MPRRFFRIPKLNLNCMGNRGRRRSGELYIAKVLIFHFLFSSGLHHESSRAEIET